MPLNILQLTIRGDQSNFSIVFIFVSCEEKDYYRVVSVNGSILTAAHTAGAAAVSKALRVKCLAQEHNTVSRSGLEPGLLDPETSALAMRSPRLHSPLGVCFKFSDGHSRLYHMGIPCNYV